MSSGRYFSHPPGNHGQNQVDKILFFARICLVVLALVIVLHFYRKWIWDLVKSTRFDFRRRRIFFTREEPERLQNMRLDSAVLETLPKFVYRSQNFTDRLECSICLCELQENETARILPNCKHSFHVDCIDKWFLSHSTCPFCRTDAQPKKSILESSGVAQALSTIPEPIGEGILPNLNLEEGQTASSEEQYDIENPPNILPCCVEEQMNAEIDEGTCSGRA